MRTIFKPKALCTVIIRIPSVLLLLPVLVLLGACTQTVPSAIATDDRPASPKPASASPVPAPLTIESLAGIYKGVTDEQDLAVQQREFEKLGANVPLEMLETMSRQIADQMKLTINSDGTFESSFATNKQRGKVKIDGNKLTFTNDPIKPIKGVDSSTKAPNCADCCTFTLNVSTDRKTLLRDDPENSSKFIPTYVKQ
ncbi:hypothetical protein H6F86_04765 [Phormidium sp. FACHB-592]|uniref:Uncharacterized protein n=1 Tax=Stenomitos frigidus AS-A4 TaxID=2933935 RepID=A0ABV0KLB2_9CYAN|nr:hypothetical protein [Phormidium sp. FACHB-592]MBD2073209.1 hypothetical protein [Phormidium sp. FACHB-592]